MNLIIDGLRTIFGFIDKCVYSLVEGVFQLIIDLANVEIFSGSQIRDFANRLYIILGLIMIFKLMISFIQIIINPDKMDDKEQGVGNILKRVIISLILIVLVPSIFDMARTIQNYVVPIIPKVILGGQTADISSQSTIQDAGRVMAYQSFLSFYGYDNPSCNDGSIAGIAGVGTSDPSAVTIGSIDAAVAPSNLNKKDACSNDPNGYRYKYVILASTALAVYLLYTLVSMAVYVAIRAIKLAVCELIAPIPIASYIDPKTSKQSFDNWVKTSFSTYLDLFVNLIGVYFIAYVFTILFREDTVKTIFSKVGGDFSRAAWVTVFIIIALLKFGKEFPKFVTGLLGLKEGGNLSGILKGAGNLLTTTVAAPRAAYAGARDSMMRSHGANENKSLTALRGAMGAFGASGRLLMSRAKGKGLKESYTSAMDAVHSKTANSINRSRAFGVNGHVGIGSLASGYMAQRADTTASKRGLPTTKEGYDYSISNIESITNSVNDALKDTTEHKIAKYYQNMYETAKNTDLKVFLDEVNSDSAWLTAHPTATLDDIRAEAQLRQTAYVNKAQQRLSNAQERLLQVANTGGNRDSHGSQIFSNAEISAAGLTGEADLYSNGGHLERIRQNLKNAQDILKDKARDDSRLAEFMKREHVDLTSDQISGLHGLKDMRDNARTEVNTIKGSQGYNQATYTDTHKNDK